MRGVRNSLRRIKVSRQPARIFRQRFIMKKGSLDIDFPSPHFTMGMKAVFPAFNQGICVYSDYSPPPPPPPPSPPPLSPDPLSPHPPPSWEPEWPPQSPPLLSPDPLCPQSNEPRASFRSKCESLLVW